MNKFVSRGEIREEFINDSVQFIPLGYIQGKHRKCTSSCIQLHNLQSLYRGDEAWFVVTFQFYLKPVTLTLNLVSAV